MLGLAIVLAELWVTSRVAFVAKFVGWKVRHPQDILSGDPDDLHHLWSLQPQPELKVDYVGRKSTASLLYICMAD